MKRLGFVFFILLAVGLACNSSGGTISGHSQNCHSDSTTISCTGTINTAKGTPSIDVDLPADASPAEVRVSLQASVGEGSVRFYVKTPDSTEEGAVASPGKPISFTALSDPFMDTVPIYLEVDGEEANDIQYQVYIELYP